MGFKMSTPDPDIIPPGMYLAEVTKVETKHSKKSGDQYWLVSWKRVEDGRFLASDIWMLEGKGMSMTKKRLKFFGFKPEDEIDGPELLGRRATLAIYHDEFQGDVRPKIDSRAEDSCFGMYPEVVEDSGNAHDLLAPKDDAPF